MRQLHTCSWFIQPIRIICESYAAATLSQFDHSAFSKHNRADSVSLRPSASWLCARQYRAKTAQSEGDCIISVVFPVVALFVELLIFKCRLQQMLRLLRRSSSTCKAPRQPVKRRKITIRTWCLRAIHGKAFLLLHGECCQPYCLSSHYLTFASTAGAVIRLIHSLNSDMSQVPCAFSQIYFSGSCACIFCPCVCCVCILGCLLAGAT